MGKYLALALIFLPHDYKMNVAACNTDPAERGGGGKKMSK